MELTHQELITLAGGQNSLLTARAAVIAQLRADGKEVHATALQAIQQRETEQWQQIVDQAKRIEITARKGVTV